MLDRLVFFFFFWFGLAGWLAGWVFKRIARICDRLDLNPVIWKSELSDCLKLTHSPPTLPSLPVSLSSLPFFLSCQIWHPVGRFLQTKWTKPANQQLQSCRYFTYLLTSLPTELLTKPDWQWCVCMCVCFFFSCFWVCLITSVEECATWWLFFVGFLFIYWQPTHKVYYNTDLLPPIRKALGGFL